MSFNNSFILSIIKASLLPLSILCKDLLIKELKIELDEAKRFKRYFNLLASASNVQICQQCDGYGGGYIDMGEQGAEGWECDVCSGAGIVDKAVP